MRKCKLLKYILIPIFSVYLFLCNLSVISFATVPDSLKVVSYTSTWDSYGINITGLGKYYVIENPTGLTTSTYNLPKFYYTNDNITFTDLSGVNVVVNQLNKIVGVILSETDIQTFQTNFFNKIGLLDSNNHAQGGLYDNNGNFYGYALNDITGCYYNKINGNFNINVPSYLPNNIYNVLQYYNYDVPPYIQIYGVSLQNVLSNYSSSLTQSQIEFITNAYNSYPQLISACWDTYWKKFTLYIGDNYKIARTRTNRAPYYFVANNSQGYSQTTYLDWCKRYNLTSDKFNLSFGELSPDFGLSYSIYNLELTKTSTLVRVDFSDTNNLIEDTYTLYDFPAYGHPTVLNTIGNPGNSSSRIQVPLTKEPFFIYKDFNTLSSLKNNTYVPSQLTTNNYKNYNVSNDNSNVVNTEYIDNSQTYNQNIYNSSTENFSEYIDNSIVDNSSVVKNVTTITNNYYNYNTGGSGDNEGGNGGENDSDGILDTLLSAILGFFDAIGKVIATIITGLLDMFSSVLSAIADLTTDLTGVTDFFGSLFGWLPEPIPQVLGVGISICILCAVIRFIRG